MADPRAVPSSIEVGCLTNAKAKKFQNMLKPLSVLGLVTFYRMFEIEIPYGKIFILKSGLTRMCYVIELDMCTPDT